MKCSTVYTSDERRHKQPRHVTGQLCPPKFAPLHKRDFAVTARTMRSHIHHSPCRLSTVRPGLVNAQDCLGCPQAPVSNAAYHYAAADPITARGVQQLPQLVNPRHEGTTAHLPLLSANFSFSRSEHHKFSRIPSSPSTWRAHCGYEKNTLYQHAHARWPAWLPTNTK